MRLAVILIHGIGDNREDWADKNGMLSAEKAAKLYEDHDTHIANDPKGKR